MHPLVLFAFGCDKADFFTPISVKTLTANTSSICFLSLGRSIIDEEIMAVV